MSDPSEDLSDAILRDRAHGQSVRAIAASRSLTIGEVEPRLDDATNRLLSGDELRRELACETVRLNDLKLKYFEQANRTIDVASAAVYTKLSERLASMLGMNAPQSHAVTLATTAAPAPETSTQYYSRMLDALDSKREDDELPSPPH
jgi:hypothetical protein